MPQSRWQRQWYGPVAAEKVGRGAAADRMREGRRRSDACRLFLMAKRVCHACHATRDISQIHPHPVPAMSAVSFVNSAACNCISRRKRGAVISSKMPRMPSYVERVEGGGGKEVFCGTLNRCSDADAECGRRSRRGTKMLLTRTKEKREEVEVGQA